MKTFHKIKEAIESAKNDGLLDMKDDILTGFSGETMVGALQRFSKLMLDENSVYLEVGVYQGLTLLSVAKANREITAIGIDNFAFFDKDGVNHGIVKARMSKLNITNAQIINKDYEDALENLEQELNGKKVGVYFIDGPHDYRSQLMCLQLIKPHLSPNAVIIIDDSNYRHVRQANRDFLKTNPEFKLLFQSYTNEHPLNLKPEDRGAHEKGWWDGVNIIVKDDDDTLDAYFPETYRNRNLYENEHAIHATKHPEVVPFLLSVTNFLSPIVYRFSKLKRRDHVVKGKYKSMNTYSDGLMEDTFNPSI